MPELKPNKPGQDRRICQCPTCGAFFAAVSVFDRHRVGDYDGERRCLTPAEMTAKGMVCRNEVWGRQGPSTGLAHWGSDVLGRGAVRDEAKRS